MAEIISLPKSSIVNLILFTIFKRINKRTLHLKVRKFQIYNYYQSYGHIYLFSPLNSSRSDGHLESNFFQTTLWYIFVIMNVATVNNYLMFLLFKCCIFTLFCNADKITYSANILNCIHMFLFVLYSDHQMATLHSAQVATNGSLRYFYGPCNAFLQ